MDPGREAEDAERARLWAERKAWPRCTVLDRIEEVDTGETYATKWAGLSDAEGAGWLRSTKRMIYAFNGTEDRLAAAVGTRAAHQRR